MCSSAWKRGGGVTDPVSPFTSDMFRIRKAEAQRGLRSIQGHSTQSHDGQDEKQTQRTHFPNQNTRTQGPRNPGTLRGTPEQNT